MQTPQGSYSDLPQSEQSQLHSVNCGVSPTVPTADYPNLSPSTCQNEDPLELSFEKFTSQHPSTIEREYRKYIQAAVGDRDPTNFGVNDYKINKMQEKLTVDVKSARRLIQESRLLSENSRKDFRSGLKSESILSQTIKGLIPLFQQEALDEIVFMIEAVWQNYRQFEEKFIIKNPIIPKFHRQFNLNNLKDYQEEDPKLPISTYNLLRQADQVSRNLQESIFRETCIKIVNLKRDAEKVLNGVNAQALFGKFLKVLCRAVFLSAEGYLIHDEQDDQADMKRISEIQFISSSVQESEDNEADMDAASLGATSRKKRKLNIM